MGNFITVMLTGIGSPAAPGVVKSLKSVSGWTIRLVGVDMNPNAASRSMVDSFYVIPPATHADFLTACLHVCELEHVDVVLPMVTAELIPFTQHIQAFRTVGTEVSVSKANRLPLAIHKGSLFTTLKDAGLAVPNYAVVRTADELKSAVYDLGYPSQTVCFKPVIADGSRGFRIVSPVQNAAHTLFHEKPNSANVSLTDLYNALESATDIPETIVMEYLPGQEYSVDLLAKDGQVLVAVPRLRETITSGITTIGTVVQAEDVIRYATKVVEVLHLHGNIGVQVRRDHFDEAKILEVNPRIQGTIVLCTAAGVNLPFLAVKLAIGMPIQPSEFNIRWDTRMIRYWEEVFYDAHGSPYTF